MVDEHLAVERELGFEVLPLSVNPEPQELADSSKKNYVIFFSASAITFQDSLLQFERWKTEERFFSSFNFFGAKIKWLDRESGLLRRVLRLSPESQLVEDVELVKGLRPDIVHILHLVEDETERAVHMEISAAARGLDFEIINPADGASEVCNSKHKTIQMLRENKIPVPDAVLLSRLSDRDTIRSEIERFLLGCKVKEKPVYLSPDRGTGGKGMRYFDAASVTAGEVLEIAAEGCGDYILREGIGRQSPAPALRVNVLMDGKRHRAFSSYATLGGRRINLAFPGLKGAFRLAETAMNSINSGVYPPLRFSGVDIVFEDEMPVVIEINSRGDVTGSTGRLLTSRAEMLEWQ